MVSDGRECREIKIATGFCSIGSRRIVYDRTGSGPVVVFLHGIGGNRSNWTQQLMSFGRDYTCIAWDAMGYGESSDPEDGGRFEHFADELNVLLDDLAVKRAHLVGLSMGGHIVQNFYAMHPDRVATLTLAATSAGMGTLSDDARKDFVARRLGPLQKGLSLAQTAEAVVDVLAGRKATPAVRERLRQSLATVHTDAYVQTVRAILTTDFRMLLPKIAVPTLVVVGEDDRVLPPYESAYLAKKIHGATLSVLPETGHLCNIEDPNSFDALLGVFLKSHQGFATSLPAPL